MTESRVGRVNFRCSDPRLTDGFAWAKRQALAYVHYGDPVGDWYDASLPGREGFCMRDLAHQATGAHVLGLARHTQNMLAAFAGEISDAKDWCTFWEINRHGAPVAVDYASDADFWYNLPANFDLVDCCYRQFQWTGDDRYLLDPAFVNFYRRTVYDYVARWDKNGDGFPEHYPHYGRRGIGSYNEDELHPLTAGDLVAAQYAAFVAYANVLALQGGADEAETSRARADEIRRVYNTVWWNAAEGRFFSAILQDGRYHAPYNFESNLLPLYFGLVEPGARTHAALLDVLRYGTLNVELRSYVPETLYKYDLSAAAQNVLLELVEPSLPRREYPEVSFAVVGAVVTGLMGIRPDAATRTVSTLPQLANDLRSAQIESLPVFDNEITVTHHGSSKTTLHNQRGAALTWTACFAKRGAACLVDGAPEPALVVAGSDGAARVGVSVRVEPGQARTVEIPTA